MITMTYEFNNSVGPREQSQQVIALQFNVSNRYHVYMNQSQNNQHLETILRMFQFYGCKANTLLTKERFSQLFNQQARFLNHHDINPELIDEFWGQAETLSKGESTVITLAKIIAEAIAILQQRIRMADDPTSGIPHLRQELQHKQKEIKAFENSGENKYEGKNDNMNAALKNKNIIEMKLRELETFKANFEKEYSQLECCLKIRKHPPHLEETTILGNEISLLSSISENPSPHLQTILTVTIIAVLLQLFILNVRFSFLSLLLQMLTLFWLFYGYYDQHFVKILLAGLAISCAFDIAYVCLFSLQKAGSSSPNGSGPIAIVGIVLLVIDAAVRLYLMILLCRYREPPDRYQFFQLFSHKIYLALRSGKQQSTS